MFSSSFHKSLNSCQVKQGGNIFLDQLIRVGKTRHGWGLASLSLALDKGISQFLTTEA